MATARRLASASFLLMTLTVCAAEVPARLEGLTTADDYLQLCMKGQNHKALPSSEDQLHGECHPYRGKSCCTSDVAKDLHANETWYRLRRNHCGETDMSDECQKYFDKELCFYECSPDLGPWLTRDSRKWREEKVQGVPLCHSDCEQWFNSCASDVTCADNWYTGFDWKDGENKCMAAMPCRTYREMFSNATTFCEKIWNYSYKVVDDSQPCMKLATEGTPNNNEAVARQQAEEMIAAKDATVNDGALSSTVTERNSGITSAGSASMGTFCVFLALACFLLI